MNHADSPFRESGQYGVMNCLVENLCSLNALANSKFCVSVPMCLIPNTQGIVVNIEPWYEKSDDGTRVESGAIAKFR